MFTRVLTKTLYTAFDMMKDVYLRIYSISLHLHYLRVVNVPVLEEASVKGHKDRAREVRDG